MKYLQKTANSPILLENLSYEKVSQRPKIKKYLIAEQRNFCAYSQRYFQHTDAIDIEHFDGRVKHTTEDSYYNWYAVLSWMNSHKAKKIDPFLPLIQPYEIADRIFYEEGIYQTCNENDKEAQHLIDYLGFNKYELCLDRNNHIKEIQRIFAFCNTMEEFKEFLQENPSNLSFYTAIESELKIDLQALIFA